MKTIFVSITIVTIALIVSNKVHELTWSSSSGRYNSRFEIIGQQGSQTQGNRIEDLSVKNETNDISLTTFLLFSAKALVYNDPIGLTIINKVEEKLLKGENAQHGILKSRIEDLAFFKGKFDGKTNVKSKATSCPDYLSSNIIEGINPTKIQENSND